MGIVFTHGVRMGIRAGVQEKVCLGCISETVRYRKLVGTLVRGCRCAMSWCDLAVVTLNYKILSGFYLGNCKV